MYFCLTISAMQFIRKFLGRKFLHAFFVKLHKLSLLGMNYGVASQYGENGEIKALRSLIEKFPQKDWVIFDVGANSGTYSRAVIDVLGVSSFRLYAFEPSSKAFEMLSNVAAGRPNILLWKMGFSDARKEMILYADEESSTLSSVYQRKLDHVGRTFRHQETVAVDTIDQFCSDNHVKQIHFLKLDVEGHEWSVLHGASAMIESDNISFIQFEFGGSNIDARTYFKDFYSLLNPKYRLFRILKDGLFEIENYTEQLEIFQSSNFLAIHRNIK